MAFRRGEAGFEAWRPVRYRIEAVAWAAAMGVFRLLGPDRASALGARLGLAVRPLLPVSGRARASLAHVFPDRSDAEREAILTAVWRNAGATFAEYAHFDAFAAGAADDRLTVLGTEHLTPVFEAGRGAIFVSGHFANFEIMPMALRRAGLSGAELYRPTNNPLIDRGLVRRRARATGLDQISTKDPAALRRMIRVLKSGGFLAMLADQRSGEGPVLPFAGKPARVSTAPARLAVRLGVPLVPASIERDGSARFVLRVHPPLDPLDEQGDAPARILALTEKLTAFYGDRILERPGEWLWLHDRWGIAKAARRAKRAARRRGQNPRRTPETPETPKTDALGEPARDEKAAAE